MEQTTQTKKKIIAVLDDKNPKTGKNLKLDISDAYDWTSLGDNDRHILFVYFYTLVGSASYHNAAESYRKAGYKGKNSQIIAKSANILRKKYPEIDKKIAEIEENTIKSDLKDAKNAIIQMKMLQATYDPMDFIESVERSTESGEKYTLQVPKILEDIPKELRIACIKNIDYKSGAGKEVYELADKEKAQAEILALDEKINSEKQGNDFDIETTIDVIKGKLEVKTTVISNNAEIAELSELKNNDSSTREEED